MTRPWIPLALSASPALLVLGPAGPAVPSGSGGPGEGDEALPRESQELAADPGAGRLDLGLEDALALALDNNYGLEIEELTTDIQRFTFEGTWGAFDPLLSLDASVTSFDPEVSAAAGFIQDDQTRFSSSLGLPITTGGRFDLTLAGNELSGTAFGTPGDVTTAFPVSEADSELSLSFTQPLLRGAGRTFATVDQRESELTYYAQRERGRQVRQELLLSVHNAYWDLVAAREERGVREIALSLGQEQLSQNRRRLDVGVGTEVDVLQAETNVATEEQRLLRAQTDVEAAEDALKSLVFRRPDEESIRGYREWWDRTVVPTTELPRAEAELDLSWTRSLARALDQRSELIQRRLDIQAAEVALQRAVSDRKAALDVNASVTSSSLDTDLTDSAGGVFDFEFLDMGLGLTYSLPLRNRTAARAEAASRASLRLARLRYDQEEMLVVADVRAAVRDVRFQIEAVAAAEKSVALARRQLAAEQSRYKEGLSTTFQVLEFQQQLAEALSSEAAARAGYAKSLAGLDRAEGELGEDGGGE